MELRDVLDLVTIAFRQLRAANYSSENWLRNIQRIFQEENVAYRVDALGGVHFYVDEEFARNWGLLAMRMLCTPLKAT